MNDFSSIFSFFVIFFSIFFIFLKIFDEKNVFLCQKRFFDQNFFFCQKSSHFLVRFPSRFEGHFWSIFGSFLAQKSVKNRLIFAPRGPDPVPVGKMGPRFFSIICGKKRKWGIGPKIGAVFAKNVKIEKSSQNPVSKMAKIEKRGISRQNHFFSPQKSIF